MSSHIAYNSPALAGLALAPPQAAPAAGQSRSKAIASTLTVSGIVLFATCVALYASGFKDLRFEIVGLLVHPFLIPIGIVSPFLVVGRLRVFPAKVLAAMVVFFGMYTLATFSGGISGAVSECIKVGTTGITVFSIALLVRSRGDFVAGALGLSAAVGVMGFKAIGAAVDPNAGYTALDVGNKNAYSLFALPAMLIAGYLILDMPIERKPIRLVCKLLLILATGACALAIFISANRSGYLGCVVIAGMLLKEKKLYGLLLVGLVAAAMIYVMISFDLGGVFMHRWKQTVEERNESDEMRGHILKACLMIGLEYPLAGVSATRLPMKIGDRVGTIHMTANMIESHNVFAHIWASSGLICFGALGFIAWTMWYLPGPRNKLDRPLQQEFVQAHRLLKMMVLLWVLRGMFTSAILYNPGFSMGFGLALGYCILLSEKPKGKHAGSPAAVAPMSLAVQP